MLLWNKIQVLLLMKCRQETLLLLETSYKDKGKLKQLISLILLLTIKIKSNHKLLTWVFSCSLNVKMMIKIINLTCLI